MAAAGLFAGQCGAGHECGESVEIEEFVVVAAGMVGSGQLHFFERGDGGGEFFAATHDAGVTPHEIADSR